MSARADLNLQLCTPSQAVNPSLLLLEQFMASQVHVMSKFSADVSMVVKQDVDLAMDV